MSHSSRTPSSRTPRNVPLASRNNNQLQPPNSYRMSKQFPKGIFTNHLNTNRNPPPPALEIEVVDTNPNRHRNSQRLLSNNRESRVFDTPLSSQRLSEDPLSAVQRQLEQLKREVFSVIPSMIENRVTHGNSQIIKQIHAVVNQFNDNNQKRINQVNYLNQESKQIRQSVKIMQENFNKFSTQNEEKLQNIFVDLAALGTCGKRSRVQGDYAVDLKNSFQAQSSSFVGSPENHGSKLVNEAFLQLESLRKELEDSKEQIEQLALRVSSQTKGVLQAEEAKQTGSIVKEEEVKKLIKDALKEDKKRWRLDERLESMQEKLSAFQEAALNQESNIEKMNEEFAYTINSQINPKIKKIDCRIEEIGGRFNPEELEQTWTSKVQSLMEARLKETRLLSVRGCDRGESEKLSVRGGQEGHISFRETYLLDEQNYILDSQGRYLVEEIQGVKQRIRIDPDLLYLLQLKGLQIGVAG